MGVWGGRFKEWVTLDAEGSRGGVAIIWDTRKVKVIDSLVGDFSVSILVEENNGTQWWLSGVYGPSTPFRRSDFWEELGALYGLCDTRWCVAGDFNTPMYPSEKSSNTRSNASMRSFDQVIKDMELIDLPLGNGHYTWSNFRESPICARLDRFLFTREWEEYFKQNKQVLGNRVTSDHHPIILDSGLLR